MTPWVFVTWGVAEGAPVPVLPLALPPTLESVSSLACSALYLGGSLFSIDGIPAIDTETATLAALVRSCAHV
jgi:hypothetical protein